MAITSLARSVPRVSATARRVQTHAVVIRARMGYGDTYVANFVLKGVTMVYVIKMMDTARVHWATGQRHANGFATLTV